MANMVEKCNEVEKMLRDNSLYAEEVRPHADGLPVVVVSIRWGDWKHEHLRCDYLMEQMGAVNMGKCITEEDGSDCFCADHYYAFV